MRSTYSTSGYPSSSLGISWGGRQVVVASYAARSARAFSSSSFIVASKGLRRRCLSMYSSRSLRDSMQLSQMSAATCVPSSHGSKNVVP
ncbi:hypothetical protein BREU_2171 [Bifidobacterium reuteri DSM 23975]|uniref:Uncharacterized protein n=1 Tax=Bifidobacterium reuteri DSM 23975 TaxID=1437610 RepID=A0A087CF55_9BIFI|nr:hypothetical protein BREU_2171 [Bifidobacterium reuteri DSM 23975]